MLSFNVMRPSLHIGIIIIVLALALACDEAIVDTNYREDQPDKYWKILLSFILIPLLGFVVTIFKVFTEKRKIKNHYLCIFYSFLLCLSLVCNFIGTMMINAEMHSYGMYTKNNVPTTCCNYFIGVAVQYAVLILFYINTKKPITQND